MITVENTLTSATVPSQVSAQLTFNGGTALTKYYYNTSTGTSTLNPGDVQQITLHGDQRDKRLPRTVHVFGPGGGIRHDRADPDL